LAGPGDQIIKASWRGLTYMVCRCNPILDNWQSRVDILCVVETSVSSSNQDSIEVDKRKGRSEGILGKRLRNNLTKALQSLRQRPYKLTPHKHKILKRIMANHNTPILHQTINHSSQPDCFAHPLLKFGLSCKFEGFGPFGSFLCDLEKRTF